jgi:hypothetical protein
MPWHHDLCCQIARRGDVALLRELKDEFNATWDEKFVLRQGTLLLLLRSSSSFVSSSSTARTEKLAGSYGSSCVMCTGDCSTVAVLIAECVMHE